MKLKKETLFTVFKIVDDSSVVVEKTVKKAEGKFEDLITSLPADECRYAVLDFEFESSQGGDRQKLVFIVWSPDTSKVKAKMLIASSKDAFRKKLVGISTEIQATDISEIDLDAILEKCDK